MGEKTGNIIKLLYDFDTSQNLEVEYSPGKWNRVTSRMFRSWNGNRKINGSPYQGPTYIYGTNKKSHQEKTGIIGELPPCKRPY